MFFSKCFELVLLALVSIQDVKALSSLSTESAFPSSYSSKFNIAIPYSLHKDIGDNSGYIHNIGNFGKNHKSPYGSNIGINMYYIEDSLCNYPVPKTVVGSEWVSPFFLMTTKREKNNTVAGAAPRDDCTITTKTRHAQMIGASGLVISDNRCVCSDSACNSTTTAAEHLSCEPYLPLVLDDGSAGDVTIPAILLLKSDGDAIVTYMKKKVKTPILVDISWHPTKMAGTTGLVPYEFVMDPLDVTTQSLLRNFKPIAEALFMGKRTLFTPHYVLIDGKLANCLGNDGAGQDCSNMCTNGGRYCYPSYKVPGKIVVAEMLRRICIWEHHHKPDTASTRRLQEEIDSGDKKEEEAEETSDEKANEDRSNILGPHAWWDYVTYFDEHCGNGFELEGDNSFATPDCIQKSYDYAAIKSSDIEECMQDSGDPAKDDINTLLQSQIDYSIEHGINGQVPAVIVNNERVYDDLWNEQLRHDFSDKISAHAAGLVGAKVTMDSLCKQFDSSPPEICSSCGDDKYNSNDVLFLSCARKFVSRRTTDGTKKKKKKSVVVLWLFIISLVGGIAFYVYKKREEMSGFQISDSMARFRYSILPSSNNNSNNAPLNEALVSS